MKVLHITTSLGGGAGIAANRLHKSLLASGVDSDILSLNYETSKLLWKKQTLYKRIINRIGQQLRVSKKDEVQQGDYEIFTSPITNYDITLYPGYNEADIINLHWVSSFLDYPSFFKNNKKPIVWTLHDMNPFQGGFHYYDDVVRNLKNLGIKEQEYQEIKFDSLSKKNNINVVALSNWILNESKKSEILNRFPHFLIPNGVDVNLYKPYNKRFIRDVFGLPQDKTIVLFVSETIKNKRKGFDLLKELIDDYSLLVDVVFCAVGAIEDTKLTDRVKYISAIKEERLMALLYSAADVFVLPSREDNLPNVMLEAMACGTPVIATPIGGARDVIIDNFNGYLAKGITSYDLGYAINYFVNNKEHFHPQLIRENIIAKYSSEVQSQNYIRLYKSILNQ